MITIVLLPDCTTALYVASEHGHSTVVQLLAEAGVSLDVQANVCNSPTVYQLNGYCNLHTSNSLCCGVCAFCT